MPVDVREHQVQHDRSGSQPRDRLERLAAGGGLVDVEALVPERGRDRVDDRRLVVDDEDPVSVDLAS